MQYLNIRCQKKGGGGQRTESDYRPGRVVLRNRPGADVPEGTIPLEWSFSHF